STVPTWRKRIREFIDSRQEAERSAQHGRRACEFRLLITVNDAKLQIQPGGEASATFTTVDAGLLETLRKEHRDGRIVTSGPSELLLVSCLAQSGEDWNDSFRLETPHHAQWLSTLFQQPALNDLLVTLDDASFNREAQALQQAGATLVQFNEPAILQHKDDFPEFAGLCRRLVEGLSSETSIYLYFGDVDGIYPQLLDLPFDLIGLDFVMGAANEALLHRTPFTKKLGLGIVDARNTRLESPDQIAGRIRALSAGLEPDHVHVSPSAGLEFLPREVAQEKLRNLAQGVRQAEGVLV
ncbi:MAG: hypothetical protein U1B78_02730, partial [Dehalococcoidia bacterium]|nr:hypothetical protein [Dehalococcoidia bacterium]